MDWKTILLLPIQKFHRITLKGIKKYKNISKREKNRNLEERHQPPPCWSSIPFCCFLTNQTEQQGRNSTKRKKNETRKEKRWYKFSYEIRNHSAFPLTIGSTIPTILPLPFFFFLLLWTFMILVFDLKWKSGFSYCEKEW